MSALEGCGGFQRGVVDFRVVWWQAPEGYGGLQRGVED